MILSKLLIGFFLVGGLSYASSLAVYQDSTFYLYTPKSNFIGFLKDAKVKCDGETVSLSLDKGNRKGERFSEMIINKKSMEEQLQTVVANQNILEQLMTLAKPTSIEASSWIESAKLLADEKSTLMTRKKLLQKKLKLFNRQFNKQAPSQLDISTTKECKSELELTIPYGYVSFSTKYEANIVEENEITVTQNLSIVNRSGVDIVADTAMFYYRAANQYVHPIHFSPWVVSKYVSQPKRVYKKARMNSAPMMELSMSEDSGLGGDIVPVAPVAQYEDAREYKINNLMLPSTGVPLVVKVLSWKSALKCEIKAYPYIKTKAFHVCSFTPKYQIDSNSWKVKSGSEVVNERVIGEYRKGKYTLYTKVEEDIQILRKSIVKKERKTGIFGGTARKQDGFTLTLTNKSNKVKELTLLERIPTSTTTEIKSKLLSINSKSKVDYKMLKDGEIEMHVMLNANETQKIDVNFEISYDKELKVNY